VRVEQWGAECKKKFIEMSKFEIRNQKFEGLAALSRRGMDSPTLISDSNLSDF
jgi:hypothetical protein